MIWLLLLLVLVLVVGVIGAIKIALWVILIALLAARAGVPARSATRRQSPPPVIVTWPSLRPGRGALSYRCRWVPSTTSTSAASGATPIRFTIVELPRAETSPSGSPQTARTWFSN